MKKIFFLLTTLMLLAGCAETIALLGPASSFVGGGNIVHSSISSAASYGVKKTTGKSPMQHALAYAEEKNPNKKKDRCISFLKKTESEACYIVKKQISKASKETTKKIKKLATSPKDLITKKIKTENKIKLQARPNKKSKLISLESMLLESVMSKKQINHLQVSIKKNFKTKNSSR